MPFGLTYAPATYQHLMENYLDDYNFKICCIFIDEVIVYDSTYEEHLENVRPVFQRIRDANWKLAPTKCEFLKRKVKYVGNVVSEHGVEIDPTKTEKAEEWLKPTTQVFVGYFRRFIKDFSKIRRCTRCSLLSTTRRRAKSHQLYQSWNQQSGQELSLTQKRVSGTEMGN